MKDNDHKRLGRAQKIYHVDPLVGRGLPLWLPHGMAIREELEKFIKELEFKAGYQRVSSPHLARESLYELSGHLSYYKEGMYPAMAADENEIYRLRPMNCPHHHRIDSSELRSYRDLPLKIAEFGQVYRLEASGALSGLLRVRGLCQNDAHLYCREDQVKEEFKEVMRMHLEVYRVLNIKNYRMRLSMWDPDDSVNYVPDPKKWEWSQNLLREAMRELDLEFVEAPGEAAFYGPKIDVQLVSAQGREESFSTIQLDFAQAGKMDLSYIGPDGEKHRPVILHRAPLGSHERMMAFLLELYEGHWPSWLAPVQVKILPVSRAQEAAAIALASELRSRFIRVEVDSREESLDFRVREALSAKIPSVLVLGRREIEAGLVSLRQRRVSKNVVMKKEEFLVELEEKIRLRLHDV